MTTAIDSNKSLNILFRPIGYRNQTGKATVEEIENWVKKENPGFIKKQPYMSLFGAIGAGLGIVALILGFKKESNVVKWLGGVLSMIGTGAVGIGTIWNSLTGEIRKSAGEHSENRNNGGSPSLTSSIEGSNDDEKIKSTIQTLNKNYNKFSTEYEGLTKLLLKIDSKKGFNAFEELIKDTTKDSHYRIFLLKSIISDNKNESAKKLLINIIKDNNLESEIRIKAIEFLRKEFENFTNDEKGLLKNMFSDLIVENLKNNSDPELTREATRAFVVTNIYTRKESIGILNDVLALLDESKNKESVAFISMCKKSLETS